MNLFDWGGIFKSHKYKEFALVADNYSRTCWNNRRKKGVVQERLEEVVDKDIRNFGCDVFQLLHQGEYEETFEGEQWGSPVLQEVVDSDGFEMLMDTCSGDSDFAALSAATFLKNSHEALSEIKSQYVKLEDLKEEKKDAPEDQQEAYDDVITDLEMQIESQKSFHQSNLAEAVKQSFQEIAELAEMRENGVMFSDQNGEADLEEAEARYDMISRLVEDKSFQKMLKLAGRVLNIGDVAIAETTDTPEEYVGITFGDEFDGMQLEDLAMIDDPDLDALFWADYADEQLTLDLFKGQKNLGFGDIILLTDISGSMTDHLGQYNGSTVSCHQMCRAFAYATFSSKRQRRVIEIPFNGYAQSVVTDRKTSINIRAGGGTSFSRAFSKAEQHISELNNPDIIFITDGQGTVYNKHLKRITDKGVRIWSYFIGASYNPVIKNASHRSFSITSNIEKSINNLAQSLKSNK